MAPEGVTIITPESLDAAFQSWQGEQLNWLKILYNQIKLEISKKSTRNNIFFHCTTNLSEFCPVLKEQSDSTTPTGTTEVLAKRKTRVSSIEEECEVDESPVLAEVSREHSPEPVWALMTIDNTKTKTPDYVLSVKEDHHIFEEPTQPVESPVKQKTPTGSAKGSNGASSEKNKNLMIDLLERMGRLEETGKKARESLLEKGWSSNVI